MHVGVEPPGLLHAGVEILAAVRGEPGSAKLEAGGDELHVALFEDVIEHHLVLLDGDGAGGVDDVPARLGVGVATVDGGDEQLLLKVRALVDVSLALAHLDGAVLGDDAGARARRVQ